MAINLTTKHIALDSGKGENRLPELPEVETIKRQFEHQLIGLSIENVDVRNPVVLNVPPEQFARNLPGAEFVKVNRRAKYLTVNLSNNMTLLFHLKLHGQLLYVDANQPIDNATHMIFNLDDGKQLRLRDPDTFASVQLLKTTEVTSYLAHRKLGPEPLHPNFTFDAFRTQVRRHRKARIHSVLIDQHVIAGIGTIYADEILYAARIHPETKVCELKEIDLEHIYEAIKRILNDSIINHGTSVLGYLDLYGNKGKYQDILSVHYKEGANCPGCSGSVQKIRFGSRNAYICPSCQHRPVGSHVC